MWTANTRCRGRIKYVCDSLFTFRNKANTDKRNYHIEKYMYMYIPLQVLYLFPCACTRYSLVYKYTSLHHEQCTCTCKIFIFAYCPVCWKWEDFYVVKWSGDQGTSKRFLKDLYCIEAILQYECQQLASGATRIRKDMKFYKIICDSQVIVEWLV